MPRKIEAKLFNNLTEINEYTLKFPQKNSYFIKKKKRFKFAENSHFNDNLLKFKQKLLIVSRNLK